MSDKEKGIVEYETDHGNVKLSRDIIIKYLVSGTGKVTNQEIMLFLQLCAYQRLNPFLREAYLIKYGDSQPATMVVGKDVFTKRAYKQKDFDGYEAGVILQIKGAIEYRDGTFWLPESENLVGGYAKVYRQGIKMPYVATVSLEEYIGRKKDGTPNRQWSRMPATMIRKVALVQALREAYPESYQGLYSPEEMPIGQELPTDEVQVPTAKIEGDQPMDPDHWRKDALSPKEDDPPPAGYGSSDMPPSDREVVEEGTLETAMDEEAQAARQTEDDVKDELF